MDLIEIKVALLEIAGVVKKLRQEATALPSLFRPHYRSLLREMGHDLQSLNEMVDEAAREQEQQIDGPGSPFAELSDNQDDVIPEIPPRNGQRKEGDHGSL